MATEKQESTKKNKRKVVTVTVLVTCLTFDWRGQKRRSKSFSCLSVYQPMQIVLSSRLFGSVTAWKRTISEDGCFGGFYSTEAGVVNLTCRMI